MREVEPLHAREQIPSGPRSLGPGLALADRREESSFVWEPARNVWMKSGRFLTLSHLYHNILHLNRLMCQTHRDLGGTDTSTSPEPTEPRAVPGGHPFTATHRLENQLFMLPDMPMSMC